MPFSFALPSVLPFVRAWGFRDMRDRIRRTVVGRFAGVGFAVEGGEPADGPLELRFNAEGEAGREE